MTDYPHLASRLYGTPLLIARPKLETLLGVFERKLAGQPLAFDDNDTHAGGQIEITPEGIAIVPILGTLVRRSSYLATASGLTSYHQIEAMAEQAFTDPNVRAVLLEIDSSGGEAGGVFDLSERLRERSQSTGKPLWAIADEAALSAAYALAVSAERIWLTRTAEVGSVGVVAVHIDQSAADQADGLAYTLLHAGAHKVDGHPHAPLSESAAADIQADIDQLYDAFVGLVATRRRMPEAVARSTEARVYRGREAINARLADQIGTRASAIQALSLHTAGIEALDRLLDRHSPIVTPEAHMPDDIPVAEIRPDPEQPRPRPPALRDRAAARCSRSRKQTERPSKPTSSSACAPSWWSCNPSPPRPRVLGSRSIRRRRLAEGMNPHAFRKQVLDAAAAADQARDIQANTPHPDSGARAESPLVAATQRLINQS